MCLPVALTVCVAKPRLTSSCRALPRPAMAPTRSPKGRRPAANSYRKLGSLVQGTGTALSERGGASKKGGRPEARRDSTGSRLAIAVRVVAARGGQPVFSPARLELARVNTHFSSISLFRSDTALYRSTRSSKGGQSDIATDTTDWHIGWAQTGAKTASWTRNSLMAVVSGWVGALITWAPIQMPSPRTTFAQPQSTAGTCPCFDNLSLSWFSIISVELAQLKGRL